MKKIIFGLSTLILFSTSIFSAEIIYKRQNGNSILFGIRCSNGQNITIHYYPNASQYYNGYGGSWSSLQEAVNNSCN